MSLVFLCITQIIVGANVFTGTLKIANILLLL